MNEFFLMISIIDRRWTKKILQLYREEHIDVNLFSLARGTASGDMLDYFGLETSEKVLISSIVTRNSWQKLKKSLQERLNIDIPGRGIAFTIPLSSFGGKRQLQFMTAHQDFHLGEESVLKDTKYELLIAVANQGYTDLIMDAARSRNAQGGTVIHAKGTGMDGAEKFLGFSLASEKEMVFLVVKREDKNEIMSAIMKKAGLDTKAKSIVFSLPVTGIAGMRLMEPPSDADTDD